MDELIEKEIFEKFGVKVDLNSIDGLYAAKGYLMRLAQSKYFDSKLEKLEAHEGISRSAFDSNTSNASRTPLTREQLLKDLEAIRKKNGGLDQSEDYLDDYYDTSSMYNDEFHETVEEVEGRIR